MTLLFAVAIAFLVISAVVVFGHQATAGKLEKIQLQRNRRLQLRIQYAEVKKAIADLKGAELCLIRQLDSVEGLRLQAAADEEEHRADSELASRRQVRVTQNTLVEVLLAEKLLSPENLQKAENYQRQSKSPYAIDEILVLLGYASPEAIQQVRRRYPHL